MHRLTYLLIRITTFPLSLLPYASLHALGKPLGTLAYHFIPTLRKRALANLAAAPDLSLPNGEVRRIAKASFQNLMITCLEYPKLAREKNISNIAVCDNPQGADEIMAKGKGAIFFCGHQANWELLFLEGTSRMPGVAIGRPIKNHYLYTFVQNMRQKFGGTIIAPKDAIKGGLRGLKQGKFFGIVGDQGMPDSGFCCPFLGRKAWTSPIPALLSYKTNTPIIVATTVRKNGKYHIRYSDPIYPNTSASKQTEVPHLMTRALALFEQGVKEHPEQWLWIHNRWKQQTTQVLKKRYRHDTIAVFIPEDPKFIDQLPTLREIYPTEEITIFVPKTIAAQLSISAEVVPYSHLEETLIDDLRFKLLINLTKSEKIDRHYQKRSCLEVVHPEGFDDKLKTLLCHG